MSDTPTPRAPCPEYCDALERELAARDAEVARQLMVLELVKAEMDRRDAEIKRLRDALQPKEPT